MIDPLGHPITVGATVLTDDYKTVTTVLRLTKCFVWVKSKYTWNNKNEERRDPSNILVIDKQLEYNSTEYPEHRI